MSGTAVRHALAMRCPVVAYATRRPALRGDGCGLICHAKSGAQIGGRVMRGTERGGQAWVKGDEIPRDPAAGRDGP